MSAFNVALIGDDDNGPLRFVMVSLGTDDPEEALKIAETYFPERVLSVERMRQYDDVLQRE